ncbi:MAG: hypothetical protein ACOVQ6_00475 [Brevundimonas sp.]
MARIYVDQADCKIAIIHSRNGLVQGFTLPREFPYLGLKRGLPIPSGCLTKEFLTSQSAGSASNLKEVRSSVWIEGSNSITALYEQVLLQRDGWATTLLMVDEDEEDDEADDRNWNRRTFQR